jgi:type IV secretory pathway TraG/TraD family ATPase VirD4
VRHSHRTVSSGGTSVSEPEVGRSLMTPDEVRRMGADEVLIFTRGHPAIRAARLQYHKQKLFQRRAAIEPPKVRDAEDNYHLRFRRRSRRRRAADLQGLPEHGLRPARRNRQCQ